MSRSHAPFLSTSRTEERPKKPRGFIRWRSVTLNHQRAVQKYVQQLHELSGKPYGMIYESLKAAFGVPRYADIPDQDWQRVVQWFQAQVEPRRKK